MTTKNTDIKAVIFDLGRVLVDIDNNLLVGKLFKGLDIRDKEKMIRRTMSDPAMVEFNSGRMTSQEFHCCMCESYGLKLDFLAFTELWCQIFCTMEGMEELVAKVAPHITVGLLSDTDPIHWNFICGRWPWIATIENPTLSYQIGSMKPGPAIFRTAARNVKTPPTQCLFVDDLQDNVNGARAIGMHAIRFENVESLRRNLNNFGLLSFQ